MVTPAIITLPFICRCVAVAERAPQLLAMPASLARRLRAVYRIAYRRGNTQNAFSAGEIAGITSLSRRIILCIGFIGHGAALRRITSAGQQRHQQRQNHQAILHGFRLQSFRGSRKSAAVYPIFPISIECTHRGQSPCGSDSSVPGSSCNNPDDSLRPARIPWRDECRSQCG